MDVLWWFAIARKHYTVASFIRLQPALDTGPISKFVVPISHLNTAQGEIGSRLDKIPWSRWQKFQKDSKEFKQKMPLKAVLYAFVVQLKILLQQEQWIDLLLQESDFFRTTVQFVILKGTIQRNC